MFKTPTEHCRQDGPASLEGFVLIINVTGLEIMKTSFWTGLQRHLSDLGRPTLWAGHPVGSTILLAAPPCGRHHPVGGPSCGRHHSVGGTTLLAGGTTL